MEVSFNIDNFKIKACLYFDERLNISKKKKISIFSREKQDVKSGWNTDRKVLMRHFEFNYSDALFERTLDSSVHLNSYEIDRLMRPIQILN